MKSQLIIITTACTMLIGSIFFLTYTERAQREHDEDFWSIFFIDPFSKDHNDFVIDNRGPTADFTYTITSHETKLFEESVSLDVDAQIQITSPEIESDQPLTITVTDKDAHQKSIEKK